jgi:hypothetical protein
MWSIAQVLPSQQTMQQLQVEQMPHLLFQIMPQVHQQLLESQHLPASSQWHSQQAQILVQLLLSISIQLMAGQLGAIVRLAQPLLLWLLQQ